MWLPMATSGTRDQQAGLRCLRRYVCAGLAPGLTGPENQSGWALPEVLVLRLAKVEPGLAQTGRLFGIHPRLQVGPLQEIAPALLAIT
jgi:hypothetical protein